MRTGVELARPHTFDVSAIPTELVGGDLSLARQADARHWEAHMRPISADTLRTELKVSMDRARELVAALRAELADVVVERSGVVRQAAASSKG
ncbi:hypothetical protein [Lentzea atacamensis]|uniref:hypothetical protein n=1 Tax=Lentzea atacamensis TaxID=531938 RepID=UPI0011BE1AAC|nr:hypothetical protein [Lentzea atacamensis]